MVALVYVRRIAPGPDFLFTSSSSLPHLRVIILNEFPLGITHSQKGLP